jgi:hypothetical protein
VGVGLVLEMITAITEEMEGDVTLSQVKRKWLIDIVGNHLYFSHFFLFVMLIVALL